MHIKGHMYLVYHKYYVIFIFLIDFHDEAMQMMTAVANASSEDEFNQALDQLKQHSIWQRPKFKDYFEKTWLTVKKVNLNYYIVYYLCFEY